MAATAGPGPLDVGPDDLEHADSWLRAHGESGQPPSALLAARLAVRERTRRFDLTAIAVLSVAFVGFTLLARALELSVVVGGTELVGILALAVFYLVPAGALWWSSRRQRRAERRLADALPRRTAHSAASGLVPVLGRLYVCAATVTYLGGVAIGLATTLLGADTVDRTLGLIFTVGTLLSAAITARVAAEEIRRPAMAEDSGSLAVDDLLRTTDTHRVLPLPLPVAFLLSIAVHSALTGGILLGYSLLGGLLWAATLWSDRRRTLPSPGVRTAVSG